MFDSAYLRRRSAHFIPLALFLFFLLCYLATLTEVHTFDALSYILDVDRKPWRELFHPHHLAYGPLGALLLLGARALGYAGSSALPMQLFNALAGALGVALFNVLVRRVTGRGDVALASALMLGSSYAYWYYAVEVEVYTVAVLALVLCLFLLVELIERPSSGRWAALGACQALAVLFHQTNMLLLAPVLLAWGLSVLRRRAIVQQATQGVGLLVQTGLPRARFFTSGLWLYLGTLGLLVALPYGLVAAISRFAAWSEFAAWTTSYARTGWWGGPLGSSSWARLGLGLSETIAQPWGATLGLGLLALLGIYARFIGRQYGVLVVCLLCWLLVYGGFFVWWEPDNIEFWIASLPPTLLLLALALSGQPGRHIGIWAGLALGATMLVLNGASISWRGTPANDLQRQIAATLARNSVPADLLLVPDGLQELYLPYYEERPNYLSLNQALADTAQTHTGNAWEAACAAVQQRIETTLASGGAVLIGAQVLQPPAELLRRHGLAQQQIDACFERYRAIWHEQGYEPPVPSYVRLPRASELAGAGGWDFAAGALGWQATNAVTMGFAGGWRLVPGVDASLFSPLMQMESASVAAIEIRMANATRASDAQLFFADAQGRLDDARSVRWTLEPTDQAVTYRIVLRGQRGWQGMITRLRLDPVGLGDGGEVRVEWIRFVK